MGEQRLALPAAAGHQTGGAELWTVGAVEAAEQVVEVLGGFDLQLNTQVFGEALDQFVLETGLAVAVLEVGGRAVARNHAQHAVFLYPLKGGGRHVGITTTTEQQEKPGRQQPLAAAQTEHRLDRHRRSIRKAPGSPYLDSGRHLC